MTLNDRLVRTLGTPSSPDRLAGELAPLPGEMDRLGRQIAALETPEDLREESAALSRSLARTGAGVDRTATSPAAPTGGRWRPPRGGWRTT